MDTWPENFGQAYAHGCVFHHAITEGLIDPRRMIQIGIRSPVSRETHDWTLAQGVTMIAAPEVHETGPGAIAARIREVVGEYLPTAKNAMVSELFARLGFSKIEHLDAAKGASRWLLRVDGYTRLPHFIEVSET